MKKVLVVVSLMVAAAFVFTANTGYVKQTASNISICLSVDESDGWVNPASLDLMAV